MTHRQRWGALAIELPAAGADELAGALGWDGPGIEIHPAGENRVRLRVFLRAGADPEAARRRAESLLAAWGPQASGARVLGYEVVEDGRWVERYQELLRPFPLGNTFLVNPGSNPTPATDRRVLRLVPGRAFGTGEHPTTQLCVAALERHVSRDSRWLDVGCGTAVLSLVARFCGAALVLGVDDDPEAVEVARDVLRANGPVEGIRVEVGSFEVADSRAWDGVVCNISARFVEEHISELVDRLLPGGVLVLSGFLAEDQARLAAACERAGADVAQREPHLPWAALTAKRRCP